VLRASGAVIGPRVVVERQPPSQPCLRQEVAMGPGVVVMVMVVVFRQPPNQP